jgi:hypothetical protein
MKSSQVDELIETVRNKIAERLMHLRGVERVEVDAAYKP